MNLKYIAYSFAAIGMLTSCIETTPTQRGYVDYRDQCRELAQRSNPQVAGQNINSADYQKQLLIVFQDCMGKHGWSVAGPNRAGDEDGPPPPKAERPIAVTPLNPPINRQKNIFETRQKECEFARQAMHHSSNARALAKACDTECANQRRLAPDMPKPAACK